MADPTGVNLYNLTCGCVRAVVVADLCTKCGPGFGGLTPWRLHWGTYGKLLISGPGWITGYEPFAFRSQCLTIHLPMPCARICSLAFS